MTTKEECISELEGSISQLKRSLYHYRERYLKERAEHQRSLHRLELLKRTLLPISTMLRNIVATFESFETNEEEYPNQSGTTAPESSPSWLEATPCSTKYPQETRDTISRKLKTNSIESARYRERLRAGSSKPTTRKRARGAGSKAK